MAAERDGLPPSLMERAASTAAEDLKALPENPENDEHGLPMEMVYWPRPLLARKKDSMVKLEDVLTTGLDLVICGTAASSVSAQRGQYYAGPGNRFWTILWETGLTDRLLEPPEYGSLLDYGIGLTDVVKDQEGMDSAIDFGGCGTLLQRRLEPYSPRYLCFNGKRAALEALGGKRIRYGLQATSFGPTRLFVAPSTSAAARRWWDAGVWKKLSDLVGEARGTRPPN